MSFVSGLDLGQAADYSALAVLEQTETPAGNSYDVRHLERFQLGTSYVDIVALVAGRFSGAPLSGTHLAVDQTGVGRAVVDLLRRHPAQPWVVKPITITSGHAVTEHDGSRGVPKKDLVSALQILLQSGRLKIARGLKEAKALVKELENFRAKITAAGNETLEAWRDGDHDDLVLAVAMACWLGEHTFLGAWDGNMPKEARADWTRAPKGVFLDDEKRPW